MITTNNSRGLKNTLDRRSTCLGSPCWMAPELIVSGKPTVDGVTSYDNRIDVWALGKFSVRFRINIS